MSLVIAKPLRSEPIQSALGLLAHQLNDATNLIYSVERDGRISYVDEVEWQQVRELHTTLQTYYYRELLKLMLSVKWYKPQMVRAAQNNVRHLSNYIRRHAEEVKTIAELAESRRTEGQEIRNKQPVESSLSGNANLPVRDGASSELTGPSIRINVPQALSLVRELSQELTVPAYIARGEVAGDETGSLASLLSRPPESLLSQQESVPESQASIPYADQAGTQIGVRFATIDMLHIIPTYDSASSLGTLNNSIRTLARDPASSNDDSARSLGGGSSSANADLTDVSALLDDVSASLDNISTLLDNVSVSSDDVSGPSDDASVSSDEQIDPFRAFRWWV